MQNSECEEEREKEKGLRTEGGMIKKINQRLTCLLTTRKKKESC